MVNRLWLDHLRGYSKQTFAVGGLSFKQEPSKLVAHTTEGMGWPPYNDGKAAPHVTINPWVEQFHQHIPLSLGARALKVGSVSTNTMGAIQAEIIGTCDRGLANKGVRPVWEMGREELEYIAMVFKGISDATGIPLSTTVTWGAYPSSYGNTNLRLTSQEWINYRGVLGHQHVPGNAHGDPGILAIGTILEIANGKPNPPAPPVEIVEEDDMQGLVEDLYIGKLGREGSAYEVAKWDLIAAENSWTRTRLYNEFLNSAAETHTVVLAFVQEFGRVPRQDEIDNFMAQKMTVRQVWSNVQGSAEAK